MASQIFTPTILWYQTPALVNFSINVYSAKDVKLDISDSGFSFSGLSGEKTYETKFDFSYPINSQNSSYQILDKFIKVSLQKQNNESWNSLSKDKKNNIKIDWDSWKDDEDTDEMPFEMPDFSEKDVGDMSSFNKCCSSADCCSTSGCCSSEDCCSSDKCCKSDMEDICSGNCKDCKICG